MMDDKAKIALLRQALQVLLNDMDFRKGACSPSDMVAAVVNKQTFALVDRALEETA